MTFKSNVNFQFHRKMINDKPFPTANALQTPSILNDLNNGLLEICLNTNGSCLWNFQDNTKGKQVLTIPIHGLSEIIKYLQFGSTDYNQFLGVLKNQGAQLTELGNETLSIRMNDTDNNRTIITLFDKAKGRILGSTVYRQDTALESKVICQYHSHSSKNELQSLSLQVFEHKVGEDAGWVTEVVAHYQ